MKVAVIPARGGSKRIPRKNIKEFCGRPILGFSIEAALKSGLFDEVIVSTDDQEIAETAKALGATVPFLRPASVSDDHATILDVMRHTIDWYKGRDGVDPDYLCLIYATAPFVRVTDVMRGFEVLANAAECGSSLSVTKFSSPIQRALRISGRGALEMIDKQHLTTRTQDLEEAYLDAGQFAWSKSAAIRSCHKSLLEAGIAPVEIPTRLVQDIDTQEDWDRAELMYRANQEFERRRSIEG